MSNDKLVFSQFTYHLEDDFDLSTYRLREAFGKVIYVPSIV